MEMEEVLNKEMARTTNLLSFVITQPQVSTSLTGIQIEELQSMNLLRVRCVQIWAKAMIKEVESKCSKDIIKSMDDLFKLIEVNGE